MLTSGQLSRNAGMEKAVSHSPATLEQVLRQLETFRKCRLRREQTAHEVFTVEDIIGQIECAWSFKLKVPHNLYGSIASVAVKRNLIEHSGYSHATRDTSNHRECRSYCWKNDDNIQPVKPLPMETFTGGMSLAGVKAFV